MALLAEVKSLPILVGALDESRAGDLVVGRSELVSRLWEAVRERSVCVTGARHMGKTWMLKLAAATHPDWASPILIDAGACQTVPELVWRLTQGLGRYGIVPREWYGRVDQWHATLENADVQDKPSAPWTMVLNGTLQHASVYPGATVPTLILDGFGAFADRLCQTGAVETARRLLDGVAAFPSDWPRLRCVISGSNELDESLRAVYGDPARSALHAALATFEVPPLKHDDARYLAACLLKGESVLCSDLHDVADAVATTTGENPFLIHNTIDWMARFQPGMWTPDRVREVPTALWNESTDADDTDSAEESLQQADADHELARAASMLEKLATPVDASEIAKPKNGAKHPVLTLPPAFVLLQDAAPAAVVKEERPEKRAGESSIARDWRRVQGLVQATTFNLTLPASFYVAHNENDGSKSEPTSFVTFSPPAPFSTGMLALAEARKALLALEQTEPLIGIETDDALFKRGTVQIEQARFEDALDLFQELARRTRSSTAAEIASGSLLNAGYVLSRLHRYEEAIGVSDALIRQYGEDTRPVVLACVAMALVNKGASLIALGRGNDALIVCRALLACSPPEPDSIFTEAIVSAQFNVAFALAQLGKIDEAHVAYEAVAKACREAQTDSLRKLAAEAAYCVAAIHARTGHRVETIEGCEAALDDDPAHARAHSLRIVVYLQLQLVGEALAAIADAFRAFTPGSLQRSALIADTLKEAVQGPALLPPLALSWGDDSAAIASGIILWLRRQLPVKAEAVSGIGAAEHTLRPIFESDTNVTAALDVVRAARYVAFGDASAVESIPEDARDLLR